MLRLIVCLIACTALLTAVERPAGDLVRDGMYLEAAKQYEVELARLKQSGAEDAARAGALYNLGTMYSKLGRGAEALALLSEARAIWERRGELGSLDGIRIRVSLAKVHVAAGEPQKAIEELAPARPLVKGAEKASLLQVLGRAYELRGMRAEAESAYRECAATGSGLAASAAFNSLAMARYHEAKLEEAQTLAQQSLALVEQEYGAGHSDSGFPLYTLAMIATDQERLPDAKRQFEKAIQLWERSLGEENPHSAMAHAALASVLSRLQQDAKAEAEFRKADRLLPRDSLQRAALLHNMGVFYGVLGRYTESQKTLEEALRLMEARRAPASQRAGALFDLAQMHERAARYSKRHLAAAEDYYRRARELDPKMVRSLL